MAVSSRLGIQLKEIASTLESTGVSFALIGGLALAPHKVVRATQDIDLLMDATMADAVHDALRGLGYECLHRSVDAANYVRHDERVDFIYAHRPAALRLLRNAKPLSTDFGLLHVVSAEGLIGLKLQGYVNDPRRTRDLEDIRSLVAANRDTLDFNEVKGYFRLFGHESLLEELLR